MIDPPHLTRELLFFVFLPGLLFEAAYHLEYDEFRRHVLSIGALAVPGVVAAAGLTALVAHAARRRPASGPRLRLGSRGSSSAP